MTPHRFPALCGLLLAFFALYSLLAAAPASAAPVPVTVQLKWKHQFQFAGFYAAQQQGYYEDAGLEVTLAPYDPGLPPIDAVTSGQAHFGVAGPELLLERLHGKPLVAVAVIMQHSPNVVLTLRTSGIVSPHDLAGKRVMLSRRGEPDIWAMLRNEDITEDQLELPPATWNIEELIDGRVDATGAYLTNTPFLLKQRNIPYTVISPRTYGVDFYGDSIFTSQELAESSPELVAAFRNATLRGWEFAFNNPQQMVELIRSTYGSQKDPLHLAYEASTIRSLVLPELVKIGHMNEGRWKFMARTYVSLGMASAGYDLDGFLFTPQTTGLLPARLLWWTAGAGAVALLLAAWLFYFNARLQGAVRRRTAELSQLNEELSHENGVRKQVENALRESEETIRAMSNATLDAIIMIDSYGKVSFWNQGASQMFGYSMREAMGRSVHELIALDEDREKAQRNMPEFSLSGKGPIIGKTKDFLARRKDGSTFPVEVVVTSFQHGGQWCAVGSVRDATQRKLAEEKMRLMAIQDSLTGASNRAHFMDMAVQEVSRCRRYNNELALIMFDLDHFKRINDNHGHGVGDIALKAFADVVRQELRNPDYFARIGGEEFVVLLPETGIDGARRVAERIRTRVANIELHADGNDIRLTVSAGVARLTVGMDDPESLIRHADAALYRAKEKGRNRVEAWLTTTDRVTLGGLEQNE